MKMTLNKETRFSTIEKFDSESKEAMIVEGYAIVFNQETMIGDSEYGFIEVIDDRALDTTNFKDVPLKYNHTDNRLILARTRNGSLTLKVDEFGLKVRAELIDTQSNRDVYKSIEAGLLDKMSFAFTVKEQSWDRTGDIPKRTITQIDRLYDVSVVDLPAYEGTSIDAIARSLELADARIKALENEKDEETKAVIRKRLKLKTND
jgi:HK97 family phage prohead protease